MKTIQVRLSKFQREELSYKIDIMREAVRDDGTIDPDGGYMAAHYGFATGAELDAMAAKVAAQPRASSRVVELDEREARAAWGEFENAYDIAADNADGGYGAPEYVSAAKRLKQAMERVAEAAKAAGFDATRVERAAAAEVAL